jgi:predicted AAA+ superfamily ATPase
MAEIELNMLTKQCPNRRIPDIETVRTEVSAWQRHRNNREAKVNWQFTTEDARIKPARLYQTFDD